MGKQLNILLSVFILSIFLINVVSAEMLISDVGVEYDSDITDAFNNPSFAQEIINETGDKLLRFSNDQLWIRVIVELKDSSGIEIVGNKTEKRELLKQRDKWYEPRVEEFISALDENKFQLKNSGFQGVVVMTTQEGFNDLINDDRVSKVQMDAIGHLFLEEDNKSNLWILILSILILILIISYFVIKKSKNNKI